MTSKTINAGKRPPEPEPERKDVRPAKTNSEFMKRHYQREAISFKRDEHRKKLEKEGNPVLLSADGSEKLFTRVPVGTIPYGPVRHRGDAFASVGDEPVRGIGAEIHSRKGQLRKKRKRTKKAKKDKKPKRAKKTKKAKKKSSK